MTEPRCSNCFYFTLEGEIGICHRYPPAATPIAGKWEQPEVKLWDWCGEHRRYTYGNIEDEKARGEETATEEDSVPEKL